MTAQEAKKQTIKALIEIEEITYCEIQDRIKTASSRGDSEVLYDGIVSKTVIKRLIDDGFSCKSDIYGPMNHNILTVKW